MLVSASKHVLMLQALLSIARLDADTVWLLLQMHTAQNKFAPCPDKQAYPEAQQLLDATHAADATASGNAKFSALLQEVERLHISWHTDCSG